MASTNKLSKKQPNSKASDIAIRVLVAIILLNIIMAAIATLIPDSNLVLVKLFGTTALFLFPTVVVIGNLRYIERYSLTTKIFSWVSIAGSIISVLLGIVLIWDSNSASAINESNAYEILPADYSTSTNNNRSSNYLTEGSDDDELYESYDYDYSDYDYDEEYDSSYNYYNYDYDDYDVLPTSYNTPSYNTRSASFSDYISPMWKIYLVSIIVMLSAFFIASCLKYNSHSLPIIGLKIASIICISYCCVVAISILLFPITFNETVLRFAVLSLILANFGFYSWLALVIIAHSEKRKALGINSEPSKEDDLGPSKETTVIATDEDKSKDTTPSSDSNATHDPISSDVKDAPTSSTTVASNAPTRSTPTSNASTSNASTNSTPSTTASSTPTTATTTTPTATPAQ